MPLPLALRQLLLLLLLLMASTITAAELPACLSVLQPSGATPLSLHADNDGTGKTSVLLRYVPPQTRGSSFVAPDLSSPSAEWRVHIYSQHTSVSLPIDLKTTAGSVNDTETKSWKIPIVVERGFRVGTHFLKASLLEFPQGCRNRQGFDEQSASQCDDVRHAEIEAEDRNADKGARRRLICATATRIFDVHLDAKNARIQAKNLDTATEDSRAEMRPRNTQKRRPLRSP